MNSVSDFELIKQCIVNALEEVYKKDAYLILNKSNERSIVFRFGLYLYNIIQSTKYKNYNIDIEYNRNGCKNKILPNHPHGAIPDLIIHKRGTNNDNLLVLEFKTNWNRNQSVDKRKIIEFMDKSGEYRFDYGATILLGMDKPFTFWFNPDEASL